MANTPAVDLGTGKFYFTFYGPSSQAADLVAMKYTGGDNPSITREWSTDALPGGTASSPDLSKDGKTVYATDNNGSLWAVDAETGDTRWSYDIGFNSAGSASTSDDGLIIPAGGDKGHLLAVRDEEITPNSPGNAKTFCNWAFRRRPPATPATPSSARVRTD
ncbi:hypothetical protein GCM10020255_071900 [Rhodococcus baikonurensis]